MSIKYVHTNIIAKDWLKLSDFYIQVFQCTPIYPERDLSGEWVEKLTGIDEVRIKGIHLSLPGYEDGPTLEIFQYEPEHNKSDAICINQQGFGHLAFHVDDVEEILARVIEHGGNVLGEVVKRQYDTLGQLTVVYAKDTEGNIIEVQNWKR